MAVLATDDNHNYHDTNSPACDSFGGVTYILADSLEYSSIINAMEEQNFYASSGPQIFSLSFENGVFRVETSPAKRICFITNCRNRGVLHAPNDKTISQSEFADLEKVEWVYVEVTDANGKKAFTRAFFKDEWENA